MKSVEICGENAIRKMDIYVSQQKICTLLIEFSAQSRECIKWKCITFQISLSYIRNKDTLRFQFHVTLIFDYLKITSLKLSDIFFTFLWMNFFFTQQDRHSRFRQIPRQDETSKELHQLCVVFFKIANNCVKVIF